MANAKFCDRCGNFFMKEPPAADTTYYVVSSVHVVKNPYHPNKTNTVRKMIDLCPKCQKKLAEFMTTDKE